MRDLVTPGELIEWGAGQMCSQGVFFGHGTANAFDEARVLVCAALGLSVNVAPARLDTALDDAQKRAVVELLMRRIIERVPAPYLTREAWFCGLRFHVDERVLVPRSPIAEWIECGFAPWIDPDTVRRVLDVGTGSGCIAVACAFAFDAAEVVALDICAAALAVARINIETHGVGDRVTLVRCDLLDGVRGRYDLIVSNPPYVDAAALAAMPPEYRREPVLGLAAGEDGLDCVRRILRGAGELLSEDGVLVVEVGASRDALEAEFPALPFVWLDLARGGENVFLLGATDLPRTGGPPP